MQAITLAATEYTIATLRFADKAAEVQSDYLRQAYDGFVAAAAKSGDLCAAVKKDIRKAL